METSHIEFFQSAKKELELADHLLYMTYPLIQETKLLLAITRHLVKGSELALRALLEYERYHKRIEPFPLNFGSEIEVFEDVRKVHKMDIKFVRLLKKLRQIEKLDQVSALRFSRKEKYFLADPGHELEVLEFEKIKRFSNAAHTFLKEVSEVVSSGTR